MNLRLRLAAVLCTLLLTAVSALPSSPCPTDAAGPEVLLPADGSVTVTVASLDELAAAWSRLAAAMDLDHDTDLNAMMREHAPSLADVFDPTRAMAFSFLVHPLMFQQEMDWTHVLPLRRELDDPATLVDVHDVAAWLQRDGYLALSSRDEILPADPVPAWWDDMLPGVIAAHADLATLIEQNRGMVEMGMASAPAMMEQAQKQAQAEGAEAPPMEMPSTEQMEGIASLARLLMDSLTAMDAAADITGDAAVLRTRFDVRADSPLALVPQPAFAEALDLTRRLPRHADIVSVSALDQSRSTAAMEDFLRTSLRESYKELIQDPDLLERWLDGYLELLAATSLPWAMSTSSLDDGYAWSWVQTTDAPEDMLADLTAMMEMSDEVEMIRITPRGTERLAGSDVHVWELDWDLPAEMTADADAEELDMITAILGTMSGEIRLAARDGMVLMSMNRGAEGMTEMLVGGGRPHARIAALAALAGPDVRQVIVGDYGPVLAMIAEMVQAPAQIGAVPFSSVVTGAGTRGGLDLSVALDGLRNVSDFIAAMEAAQ